MANFFQNYYRGRRVLVTGHTGFKGAWLTEWLLALGAKLTGYSLPPPTAPSLFEQLGLAARIKHVLGDVNDRARLTQVVAEAQPEVIFHLAAQPLVRDSYADPVGTFAVNVMGTVHMLEAVRAWGKFCVVVGITSDKCYENREWLHGYREADAMGGYDPYSASKGCAELVIAAYRRSFFQPKLGGGVALASARAGNVLGGGDWAKDRIVPDVVRALMRREAIRVRNPHSTRPWQHVLEPLSGYLALAARLGQPEAEHSLGDLASAYNFGPEAGANRTVGELVEEMLRHWPGEWTAGAEAAAPHEAGKLNLSTDKAFHLLGWLPTWGFAETLAETMQWYREVAENRADPATLTRAQIAKYSATAGERRRAWAI
jgi:CDP-glucose 4,6-dehydratase